MKDMKEKHLLDRDLEHELNRNIDLILTASNRKNEDEYVGSQTDIPDISFEQALREINNTASNMMSVSGMLIGQTIDNAQYRSSDREEVDPAIKSSSILLLCSQIRYLQKLSLAMRMRQDG